MYRVYSSRRVSASLRIISHVSVLLSVAAFAMLVISSYIDEPMLAVRICFAAAVPFAVVTALRKLINAPRPYELYSFYECAPKKKKGSSFPSRHVFSSFLISVLAYILSPWLTVAAMLSGIALSVSRVLLGIHFIRDVVTGALAGAVCGALGMLTVLFI